MIPISRKLYSELENRVKESDGEFDSVEAYVKYILEEIVKPDNENTLSEEDEEKIKENLKKLGYL
jgi:hypothetical protein